MTVSNSLLSYQDCTKLLEAAMEDTLGARLKVRDMDEAYFQRGRIHYCRKLWRKENAVIYEPGHAMHGRTIFDALVVRIRNVDGEFYIYLERTDEIRGEVEGLSQLEAEAEVEEVADEPATIRRI